MQQNKTMEERFEEKFLDKNNFWKTIEGRGTYYKPEDVLIFINSEISQEKSKSFQEGREEVLREILEMMPEEQVKHKLTTHEQSWYKVDGFNQCRTEVLEQINKYFSTVEKAEDVV